MDYPTIDQAHKLLKKYKIHPRVIIHSKEASHVAEIIGKQVNLSLDITLLKAGGLLHDIGKWKYLNQQQELHAYETWRVLANEGYDKFGKILWSHPMGGFTSQETTMLGFPKAVDTRPTTIEAKIISIADKIRPSKGIKELQEVINDYTYSQRLRERYFCKVPGLLINSVLRIKKIWSELIKLGMNPKLT